MKLLKISGCANCPYLTIWNDGTEKGIDSMVRGSCNHPSFNKELGSPYFNSTVFLKYDLEGKIEGTNPDITPLWCPLPNE